VYVCVCVCVCVSVWHVCVDILDGLNEMCGAHALYNALKKQEKKDDVEDNEILVRQGRIYISFFVDGLRVLYQRLTSSATRALCLRTWYDDVRHELLMVSMRNTRFPACPHQ
jgi:hypothetical protein